MMHEPDQVRTPLLDAAGAAMLQRLREHPDAPRWNYAVGDRLLARDLPKLNAFRAALEVGRGPRGSLPPSSIVDRFHQLHTKVPYLRRAVADASRYETAWSELPTTCRADLAAEPWRFVPDDADLERLLIYRTAGTTGHPIEVPHHPFGIACYQPLVEHALAKHGVALTLSNDQAACFLISAQIKTYTYATVLSGWQGAGFAKVNLRRSEWPSAESARRYFEAFSPQLITGEPVAFSELLALGANIHPKAMISTSVAMPPKLHAQLHGTFDCPIIDWYSMVETGPIAYQCPLGQGLHILPHDLHVEVVDAQGRPVAPGQRGEVTLSGGRNRYLPLLRYRTGDHASMTTEPCECGDPMPRLTDLSGRLPMLFRASDGTPVGSVDLSRLLREFPLLLHTFEQRQDRSCFVVVRPRADQPAPSRRYLLQALHGLLGDLPIELTFDPSLGDDGPVEPYRSALQREL